MDAVSDPDIHTLVMMTSAQVGKTEILNNIVGYLIDQDPSPMLMVQPTDKMGEAWSKDRLAPMLRDTPALRGKVKDARSRDSGNTLLHKTFPGGHITIAGANSPASLASRPVRAVLCDEVDRYPASAGTEGDPVALAFKRAATFWNAKRVMASTPTLAGLSRIDMAYSDSDQRKYYVACDACGHAQILAWPQVKWAEGDPDSARYHCENCEAAWDDAARWRAIRNGEWVATAKHTGIAGFWLSALYSPWSKLSQIARDFLEAKNHPERLKTWVNTTLGETWQERGEAPDWEKLQSRCEDYRLATVPAGGLFLTAGADVQADRLEVQVVAWGRGKESWLVDYLVLDGDTSQQKVWSDLTEALNRSYRHASGIDLSIVRFGVDSGFRTQEVYSWARQQGPGRVLVLKGQDHGAAAIGQPTAVDINYAGKRVKRGCKVWPVATPMLKSELYGWLNHDRPEPGQPFQAGFCHFPARDPEFFKQLTAEQYVTKTVKGFRRGEWVKTRERNEVLDTRIYARAAASQFGMDRFSERDWRILERQAIAESGAAGHATPESAQAQAKVDPEPRPVGWTPPQSIVGVKDGLASRRSRVTRSSFMDY